MWMYGCSAHLVRVGRRYSKWNNRGQTTISLCPATVDPQKLAKMLAQFWRRFHNGGIAV